MPIQALLFMFSIFRAFKFFFPFTSQILNGKVKNLERQKKALMVKLEQNPIEQLNKLQRELSDTKKKLEEANHKLAVSIKVYMA